ncbi:YdiU family protein [Marinicauda salina]|uniref:Protein nucleotidyltransferase YdiU n=1 Tax=Marinicauda salina TaxID=2135793 RepID=A0A2U2BS49_9PROT|nr:YdiU family protein [Marinicauda salina]PWE16847.1 YdiU family protein [Marinicauda salina]
MTFSSAYRPEPAFAALGPDYGDRVDPADFPEAEPRFWNDRWAAEVGLDALKPAEREAHFHRFEPLPHNQAEPLALRYHGHQFRTYNPQIGDGRGFLFAQLRDSAGRLLDLGTKGSGQTPYSRTGDGRLTLKGAVREILAAEMLEALGVYTSKILSVYETGEALYRGDEPSPTRSAVLTRLQHSHVRLGMFQRHAYFDRPDLVEQLMDYSLERLLPEVEAAPEGPRRAADFLRAVGQRSARLAAQWMAAGFVHGVLNTDNLLVTGESFDYGPWRFLPHFEPGFTAAYFDETGLYAYARQPESVFWALQQLAGALAPIGERDSLIEALSAYPEFYKAEVPKAFLRRLGIAGLGEEDDAAFVTTLLDFMKESEIAWEGVFFDWFCGRASQGRALKSPRADAYETEAFKPVREGLEARAPVRPERLEHPRFGLAEPAHMTIEVVEGLWAPVAEADDWSVYDEVLADIAEMRRAYDLGRDRVGFLEG